MHPLYIIKSTRPITVLFWFILSRTEVVKFQADLSIFNIFLDIVHTLYIIIKLSDLCLKTIYNSKKRSWKLLTLNERMTYSFNLSVGIFSELLDNSNIFFKSKSPKWSTISFVCHITGNQLTVCVQFTLKRQK